MTGGDILLRFLSVLLLIALNAFFVAAEFSIVSVRRSRISQLVEAGDVQAQTVQSLQQSIERLLSTTQIGITLYSLALGWIGESALANKMTSLITNLHLPIKINGPIAHLIAILIAFFCLAYLQIVLGELCPKSIALFRSEEVARLLGRPIAASSKIFAPIEWVLNRSTRLILKTFGVQYSAGGWYNRVTPEELQLIVTTERESTGMPATSRKLLKNVFEFSEVVATQVMIPRTDLVAISYNATFEKLLNEVATTGHSCYPVIGDSLDDIRGLVDYKDLALPLATGKLDRTISIESWVKPIRFVSESTILSELLPSMQRDNQKMVVVVDEFGGTAGLISLADLINILVDENSENSNSETVPFTTIDENTFLVLAQMNLEEVNELLDLDLPLTDRYQTLGGFLLYQFQKIPNVGETLQHNNLDLTVIKTIGPRLYQIRIHRKEANSNDNNNNTITNNLDLTLPETIPEITDEEISSQNNDSDSDSD